MKNDLRLLPFTMRHRLFVVLNLVILLSVVWGQMVGPVRAAPAGNQSELAVKKTYLPILISGRQPVLLGTYSQDWVGDQTVMDNEYHALDTWAGKSLSIVGVFSDMLGSVDGNIRWPIQAIWDNGYTPFINLTVQYDQNITSAMIANGYADDNLHAIARAYNTMARSTQKMIFLAPLQEMNGNWVPYGLHPADFIAAYKHIQLIFTQEGVPPGSVRWVFAPNGWSATGDPLFEDYYPGDAYVDAVGFSSYNFGYCSVSSHKAWQNPPTVFQEYINRLMVMAPGKPIFITQTGTSALTKSGKSVSAKNQWLTDAYNYLVTFPDVRGVIYYNRWNADCDWAFYHKGGEQYEGYQDGVANPAYYYVDPLTLKNLSASWP